MAQLTKIATKQELPAGTGKVVEVDGRAIALFNAGGSFYAVDNTCKHRGGPLGEGALTGTSVMCPWHGWSYDVTTGACAVAPSANLQTYPVTVDGNDLLISI